MMPANGQAILMVLMTVSLVLASSGIAMADFGIKSVNVGEAPKSVTINPYNGSAYVTNFDSSTVSVINSSSSAVIGDPIRVGLHPFTALFNAYNNRLYVVNTGDVLSDGSVSVIDSSTNTVLGEPIPVGINPVGITMDPYTGRLYVVNSGDGLSDGSVSVIDSSTNIAVRDPIEVGKIPWGIGYNSFTNKIYVANAGSNTISVIDPQTNSIFGRPISVSGMPMPVAINPLNGSIYIGQYFTGPSHIHDSVTVISPEGEVVNEIATCLNPHSIIFDQFNGNAYIANSNVISIVNGLNGNQEGPPIPTEVRAEGIAFNPSNRHLYAAVSDSNTVSIIDVPNFPYTSTNCIHEPDPNETNK